MAKYVIEVHADGDHCGRGCRWLKDPGTCALYDAPGDDTPGTGLSGGVDGPFQRCAACKAQTAKAQAWAQAAQACRQDKETGFDK
jgi:hypothetical protein